jgi:8-oxo-dGTP diphosphatase
MNYINVTCAIILNNEKVLVVQRNSNMKLPLKWEFPGGKVEEGESEEMCIIREIKEELNIEIELLNRLTPSIYTYSGISIRLIPFIANYTDGEVSLFEHKQYVWLRKSELSQLDWAEADKPILNEFFNL